MLFNAAALLLLLPAVFAAPATSKPKAGDIIPGQYIVVMKDDITTEGFTSHQDWVGTAHTKRSGNGGSHAFTHTYKVGGLKGYAGKFDDATIEEIASRPEVAYVEPDKVVGLSAMISQQSAPWGLVRISHRKRGSTAYWYDNSAGYGTYAYVVDTGVLPTHSQFGGRAVSGKNFIPYETAADGHGHGTHVSGTIIGSTYGVAKRAKLVGVKVLDSTGWGSNSGVIAGVQWVVSDAKAKGRIGKTVANMSLGGSYSSAVNSAVNAAITAGIPFAVAAGNDGANAANYSPASVSAALTVGATDSYDARPYWSNYGSVLDIFAPGNMIKSAWIGSNSATNIISGTSMATPHVAGVSAYLMAKEGLKTPAAVRSRLVAINTANVVTNIAGTGSPNRLLYNACGH